MVNQPEENNDQTAVVETPPVKTPARVVTARRHGGSMSKAKRLSRGYRKHLRLLKQTGQAK